VIEICGHKFPDETLVEWVREDRGGFRAAGPWNQEPSKIEWLYAGFVCQMLRNTSGAWCGYVGIQTEDPLYRHGLPQPDDMLKVHGGVTFDATDDAGTRWIGFNCANLYDRVPIDTGHHAKDVYRAVVYVAAEVEDLARQIAALDGPAVTRYDALTPQPPEQNKNE
jgi:hypothetical protein